MYSKVTLVLLQAAMACRPSFTCSDGTHAFQELLYRALGSMLNFLSHVHANNASWTVAHKPGLWRGYCLGLLHWVDGCSLILFSGYFWHVAWARWVFDLVPSALLR